MDRNEDLDFCRVPGIAKHSAATVKTGAKPFLTPIPAFKL